MSKGWVTLDGTVDWQYQKSAAEKAVRKLIQTLQDANLTVSDVENHSDALADLVRQIEGRLLGIEIAAGLEKLSLPNVSLSEVKRFIQARGAIRA